MKIRRHYFFFGMVQGVGFRYRAYNAANSLGIAGYVRNLGDGSVEMEAEGTPEAIDRLILLIENGSFINIENMECTEVPIQNEFCFRVR